jgi:hypothetical protein
MVAAGGQIAAAFGAGGPVGAAIVAGTVAVDAFSASLLKVEGAREAAFEKNFERQYGNILRMAKATQEINDRIRALDLDIMYVGVESDDRAILLKQEESIKLREQANALDNQAGDARRVMAWSERERMRGEAKQMEVRANKLEEEINKTIELKRARDGLKAPPRAGGRVATPSDAVEPIFDEDSFENTDNDVNARAREARKDAEDRAYDARAKLAADRINAEIEAEKEKNQRIADNEEMFANMRYEQAKAARQKELEDQSQFVMQLTGIGVSALQTYLDAKIKGEENAEALMAASLMRTAGNALIGHGINLAGAAVVSAGTGLLPLAATQAAGAAGLIAGGVALGATATGIEHVAAGGTVGKAMTDRQSTRDPGASPRSGSISGSGGPMIINVAYGAGGPLPEDIAREIHKVTSSGNRRRGAA